MFIKKLNTNQVQNELDIINAHPGMFSAYEKSIYETVLSEVQDNEIGFAGEYTDADLEKWLNDSAEEYKRNLKQIFTDYSSKQYRKETA